jgi:SPX domain protein involved in polyphosphate accumulation
MNYAAVAKILKKHDKLTHGPYPLRAPYLSSMLHQPFLSTESISRLVGRAERHVKQLTGGAAAGGAPGVDK